MLPPRTRWLIWFAALIVWVAVWLYPLSDRLTRLAGAALLAAIWIGSNWRLLE